MGLAAPDVERVEVGVSYATRTCRVPPEVMRGRVAVVLARTAAHPRGAVAQRIEKDRVIISFTGYRGYEPVPDANGLARHARALAFRDIEEFVTHGEPLGPIAKYRVAANERRRYETLETFPEGFLVVGDALCAFNPIYAQGMTVAAVEALVLRDVLADDQPGLATRFFSASFSIVDAAWRAALANDLEMPGVRGKRPRITRVVNWWMRHVLAAAETDAWLSLAFVRITNLVDPLPRLFSWQAFACVLAHRWRSSKYELDRPAARSLVQS